jgi:hypothetical protein
MNGVMSLIFLLDLLGLGATMLMTAWSAVIQNGLSLARYKDPRPLVFARR